MTIDGRIASLLEVGTGFHPELTGRENIYLNGAVMGMSHAEMRRKFDEIVTFAEVEKFLDTPVKRYSSGHVRAAGLCRRGASRAGDPDRRRGAAVGDAEFQKKCLGKIGEVVKGGRTVLLVSHNLQTVTRVCARALILDAGRIVCDAEPQIAVSSYLSGYDASINHVLFQRQASTSHVDADITRVEILDQRCEPKSKISTFDFVRFRISIKCFQPVPQGSVIIEINNSYGITVLMLETSPYIVKPLSSTGSVSLDCCIDELPLIEGQYFLSIGLAVYGVRLLTWYPNVANLAVSAPESFYQNCGNVGVIAARYRWEQTRLRQNDY